MTFVEKEYNKAVEDVKSIKYAVCKYTEELQKAEKRLAQCRLMNDIRLGKIIPVVAENGTVADVTFS